MAEKRLYDAASTGNERALHELLHEDPFLLDRVSYTCPNKTPLHVATIHGHLAFVQKILNLNPQLAQELDSQQSSALHIASANGNVAIARSLSSAAPDMCLSRDCQGRNPLHLAAMKGHVGVLRELVQTAPLAAREKLDYRALTVLHLCVKHSQLEALKFMLKTIGDPVLINSKDSDGNTILHLAVANKQVETISLLVSNRMTPGLEVNAVNLNGMTPMDVLNHSMRDIRDSEIQESLKNAGAYVNLKNTTNYTPSRQNSTAIATGSAPNIDDDHLDNPTTTVPKPEWHGILKKQDEWLAKKRDALMVVASLIATMAFQVGVSPPGGVWSEDNLVDAQGNPVANPHLAGTSVMARNYHKAYPPFYACNTTSFIASLSIILLLMSGLPIRRRFFMWILMVIMWVAITATALTYSISLSVLMPDDVDESMFAVIGMAVLVWLGLMALLLLGHTIRLIVRVVKNLVKIVRRRAARRRSQVLGNNVRI